MDDHNQSSPPAHPKKRRRRTRSKKGKDTERRAQETKSSEGLSSPISPIRSDDPERRTEAPKRTSSGRGAPADPLDHATKTAQNRKHPKRQPRILSPENPRDKLRAAVLLIDEAARQLSSSAELMRLSPVHLNLIVGEGASPQTPISQESMTLQVDKLMTQLQGQINAQVPTEFQRGAVFCFQTDTAVFPPLPDSIFNGYDAVGRPIWVRLLPLCLERQTPHIERLYASPPRPIKLVMRSPIGVPLISEIRGGRVYDVIGQVVIGPLSHHFSPAGQELDRPTLSVQIVLSQPEDRATQLRLNVLGLDPDELFDSAAHSAPRGPLARARDSLHNARREVRSLHDQLTRGQVNPALLIEEAEGILSRLGDQLLRTMTSDRQRTHHGQQRHQSMERPTSEAWRDASRAGHERLFWDQHQSTIIVIGPKSRAHVFSESGQHVTSIRLGVGELERKRQKGRWRALEVERINCFKEVVSSSSR